MESPSSVRNTTTPQLIFPTILIGLAFTVFAVRIFKRRAYDVHQLVKLPGAHWLWGHERKAWEMPDSEWYIHNAEENGLVVAMKGAFWHPTILAVSDPAALHHICTYSHRFVKSPFNRPFTERLVGRGLFWAERAEHTRQRQMVAPYFTAARVKEMDEDVQTATEAFIEKFRHHLVSNLSTADIDGQRLTRPALDIIGKVALSYDFGCGESSEAQRIRKAWKDLTGISMTPSGFVGPLVIRTFPWIGDLPFGIIQAQGTVKTIVKDVARKIVADMKQAGEDVLNSRNNLLWRLMKSTDANNGEDVDAMLDQLCTFVIAGHETTTATLAMTLMELAKNVDIQVALRKEIGDYAGSGPGGQLTYDDLLGSSLPLLDAVCKEGLRVWPVGSHRERIASEDEVIPLRYPLVTNTRKTLDSIRVQKGQVFYLPTLAINLNTQVWGADGHKFDPYRWIEPGRLRASSDLTGGIDGHFSFLEGPRICLGYRLARFEFKAVLSALVKNFEFKTKDPIQTMWATTLQPYVAGQKEAGPQLPLFVKPIEN